MELIVDKKVTDVEMKEYKGHFFDREYFDIYIDYDCDGYYYQDGIKKLLFRFRKNIIPKELCDLALECYEKPSKSVNYNRGASAGILDVSKLPLNNKKIVQTEKFRGKYYNKDNKLINYQIGNMSHSNIIGYFDDSKKKDFPPCRMTRFTKENPEVWEKSLPVISYIDKLFRELIPDKWQNQYDEAKRTNYHIKDTCFSTITLNNNFRTACHCDRGDYEDGFGNLVVFRKGEYKGGELGLPQFKTLINIQHGDYLAFDVHQWHCNTPIEYELSDINFRLSLVLYLRKNISKCEEKKIIFPDYYERHLITNKKDVFRISYTHSSVLFCMIDDIYVSNKYNKIIHYLIEKYDIVQSQKKFKYTEIISKSPLKLRQINADYSMKEILNLIENYCLKLDLVILLNTKKILKILL